MSMPPKAASDTALQLTLNTEPNLSAPDDFYEALIHAHRDLSETQSEALNARLILLLANHVGDQRVLAQALDAARRNVLLSAEVQRMDAPRAPNGSHNEHNEGERSQDA